MMKWNLDAERELWSAICAPNRWHDQSGNAPSTHPRSLWWFVHLAWGAEFFFASGNPRWLVDASRSGFRVHGPYLEWLQQNILAWKAARAAGRGKRMFLAVILPRAFGKSVTTTKCASLWAHLDEPDMSTLICSAVEDLSIDFLRAIQVITGAKDKKQSWFSWLYGNWYNPEREWTKRYCHHGYRITTSLSEPSFDVSSADIGMTGYHHRWHVWDDPISKNKLRDGGAYLDNAHTAFNASYKALQPDGMLMLVCTRYLDDDIAGRHLRDEGVRTWDGLPCPNSMIFEKFQLGAGVWRVFFWQVEDELTGRATCPEIMDEERIAQEKGLDAEDFACQYQNDPGASEHAPLLEKQVRDIFVEYKDFKQDVPVENASIHLDTAFKNALNIRKGDESAIVPFYHDMRSNGIIYLDTDKIKASNAWRSEQFSDELHEVMQLYRRELVPIKCITDEKETGGKEGIYKQNLIASLRGAGLRVPRIHQFNRQGTKKRERIRKAAGLWAEGYVRILLHKDARGYWEIPPATRRLLNQIMRIDVVKHDDLADAAADVFAPEVWRKPSFDAYQTNQGAIPRSPGDEGLQAISRPLTNEELRTLMSSDEPFNNGLGDPEYHPLQKPR
jgi:hypothetical protein